MSGSPTTPVLWSRSSTPSRHRLRFGFTLCTDHLEKKTLNLAKSSLLDSRRRRRIPHDQPHTTNRPPIQQPSTCPVSLCAMSLYVAIRPETMAHGRKRAVDADNNTQGGQVHPKLRSVPEASGQAPYPRSVHLNPVKHRGIMSAEFLCKEWHIDIIYRLG